MLKSDRYQFITEGAWLITGQIVSAIGTLLGLRLLTAFLSPPVFGEVMLAIGISLLASGLAATPFMQGVLRYYPESAAQNNVLQFRSVINKQLKKLTVLTSGILLSGFLIYSYFVPVSIWLGPIVTALLIIDVLRQRELTLFNASRRQGIAAIWTTAEVWTRPALACLLIYLTDATAVATLTGYMLASVILFLLFRPLAVRAARATDSLSAKSTNCVGSRAELNYGLTPFDDHNLGLQLFRYSMPLMPLGAIGWISGQADRYLIGGMMGLQEAGLYAALYGLVTRPFLMAAGTLESWLRPLYYQYVSASDADRSRQVFFSWLIAILCVSFIGIAAFSIWHREIAALLLADSYRQSSWIMPWIALGYGLLVTSQVYERVCYAHNKTMSVLLIEGVGSMTALVATSYLLSKFGFAGAAYAVPFYFGLQLLMSVALARKAEQQNSALVWFGSRASA